MSMTATGSGTAIWGNEEWSYDGAPFKSFPPSTSQTLAAGTSLLWRVLTGGPPVVGQPVGFTVTVRTHYAVNEDSSDYPNPSGFAQDNVISTTYTCQP